MVQMVREGAETGYLPNSSDFMREFEVSRRTVARDLDFLRDEERAPLAYDDARHGFRLTDETYTLPPVRISRREAFSFALARKLLAHYEGTPLHLDMRSVLDKIAESLEGDVTIEPDWLSEHVGVLPEDRVRIDPDVWAQLAGYVERREAIRATYQTFDGRDIRVRTAPLPPARLPWELVPDGVERGEGACGDVRPVAVPADRGDGAGLHTGGRVQPRDIRPAGVRHRGRRAADQGPAAVRAETGRVHHRTAVAPVAGVPGASGRTHRDAAGNDGTQGTGAVGPILDAGREGGCPEEPAGPNHGEITGWTPGTAMRQNGPSG